MHAHTHTHKDAHIAKGGGGEGERKRREGGDKECNWFQLSPRGYIGKYMHKIYLANLLETVCWEDPLLWLLVNVQSCLSIAGVWWLKHKGVDFEGAT